MSDEIDIEEHDVLDNPTLQRIFPDLSVIKQEINQYYEEASNIVAAINDEDGDTTSSSPKNNNNVSKGYVAENISEDIDSKHLAKCHEVKNFTNISYNDKFITDEKDPPDKEPEEELLICDNVIILGSKPSRLTNTLNNRSKTKKEPKIVLKNISHFLKTCKRYCNKCHRLFPKQNIFTLHNYNIHTLKIQKSNNEVKDSHTIKQTNVSKELLCFHCNTSFPTQRALIEHLYDILDPKAVKSIKSTPNSKEQKGSTSIEKPVQPKEKGSTSIKKPVQTKDKRSTSLEKPIQPKDIRSTSLEEPFQPKGSTFIEKLVQSKDKSSTVIEKPIQLKKKGGTSIEIPVQPKDKGSTSIEKLVQPEEKGSTSIEKPVQPKDKRRTSLEKPIQRKDKGSRSIEKPVQLKDKSSTSVEKLVQPKKKGSTVIEKPVQLKKKGGTSVDKSVQPKDKSSTSIEKLVQPKEKGSICIEKPVQPKYKRSTSVEKPFQPKDKGSTSIEKPVQPEEKVSISVEKPVYPRDKGSTSIEKPGQPKEKWSISIENPVQSENNLEKDYYLKQLLNRKSTIQTLEQNKNIQTIFSEIYSLRNNFHNNSDELNGNKSKKKNFNCETLPNSLEPDKSNQAVPIMSNNARKRKSSDDLYDNYESKKKANPIITDSVNQSTVLGQSKTAQTTGINTAKKCECNANELNENCPYKKEADRKIIYDSSIQNKLKDCEVSSSTNDDNHIKTENINLYKCFVCSKYHLMYANYSTHMKKDHNMEVVPATGRVKFDPICQFCKSRLSDYKSYNSHFNRFHKNIVRKAVGRVSNHELPKHIQQNETKTDVAFKSILFKCVKCETFCLTVGATLRHYEDEHLLTHNNWTCSICKKVFKNKYKELHLQQHENYLHDSNTFTVYSLSEPEIWRTLYKCSQCAVHYSENHFIAHYAKCDLETPDSIYCKECDVLINREDMNFHVIVHQDKTIQYSDFTVIESEPIVLKMKTPIIYAKTPQENCIQNGNKYAFCSTCECFVPITCHKKFLRLHYNGRCNVPNKIICRKCGIIISSGARSRHALMHEKMDLNLQDLMFYEFKSKMQICPPVPKYLNCKRCGIHFLTKSTLQEHLCDKQKFKTCKICLTKLTNQAFKLHMQFHNYSIQKVNKESKSFYLNLDLSDEGSQSSCASGAHFENVEMTSQKKDTPCIQYPNDEPKVCSQVKSKFILHYCETCKCFIQYFDSKSKVHRKGKCGHIPSGVCPDCGLVFTQEFLNIHKKLHKKQQISIHDFIYYEMNVGHKNKICPPIPKYPCCDNCGVHFLRNQALREHLCDKQEYVTCNNCSIKLTERAFELHMGFHNYSIDKFERQVLSDHDSQNDMSREDDYGSIDDKARNATILYLCKSCETRLNTYDRVVQHCQNHYDCDLNKINTQKCVKCDLTFEVEDYNYHNNLHLNGKFRKESVTVIDFDPFYFRFDCEFWTKHVFAYVADEQIKHILNSSMYKYECRLKMVEIQSGLPGLTLYQCDKCSVCIQPHMVYKHADTYRNRLCERLRNYLCNICGLSFDSASYRDSHQEDHKNADIKLTSFTIIVFNKREHDNYSKIMFGSSNNYILYQCRRCECAVEKFRRNTHVCEVNHLVKCLKCGLLLHKNDYDLHFFRHEELEEFDNKNIVVIKFGKIGVPFKNKSKSNFIGTIHDYTFYKCNNCELCIKCKSETLSHICVSNYEKCKCPKCGLNFTNYEMEGHSKFHDSAVELDDLSLNLVTFDPPSQQHSVKENVIDSGKGTIEVKTNKLAKEKSTICSEVLHRLFKCDCGLHFLEELNAQQHADSCNIKMKISKQICFKCNLLFTPGELFNHLLKHHCDKKIKVNFDVVMVHKKIIVK